MKVSLESDLLVVSSLEWILLVLPHGRRVERFDSFFSGLLSVSRSLAASGMASRRSQRHLTPNKARAERTVRACLQQFFVLGKTGGVFDVA